MNHIAILVFLTATVFSFGQSPKKNRSASSDDETKGTPITFHVTSVRQEDLTDCDPDKCSSKLFRIEGYADTGHTGKRTYYELTCTEALVYKPTPQISVACARIHANSDYAVRLFADSINFWPAERYAPPPFRAFYSIVSEKEGQPIGF